MKFYLQYDATPSRKQFTKKCIFALIFSLFNKIPFQTYKVYEIIDVFVFIMNVLVEEKGLFEPRL